MSIYGPNLIPNGTFQNGLTGFGPNAGGILSVVSGRLLLSAPNNLDGARSTPNFTAEIGETYLFQMDWSGKDGSFAAYHSLAPGGHTITGAAGSLFVEVTATSAAGNWQILNTGAVPGQISIDNVSVRKRLVEGPGMALTSQGFKLYVTLIDAGGDQSTLSFQLTSLDHATALTDSATILTRLAAVSAGAVKSYSIANVFIEDALTLPLTGQVEERATVIAQISGQPLKKQTIHIPAPVTAIFLGAPGTTQFNIVDGTDAALLAYLETWTLTDGIATISDGEYLDDDAPFVEGRRTHRGSSYG